MMFGGSIQGMLTTLKNNARPKRNAFDKSKKDKQLLHLKSRRLKYKTVSDSKLKEIKHQIRLKAQKDRKRLIAVTVPVSMLVLFLIYLMIQSQLNSYKEEAKEKELERLEVVKENQKQIDYLLENGSYWMNKGHYLNAKKQFYKAYLLDKKDYKVLCANARVYVMDCIENKVGCKTAERIMDRLKNEFGDRDEVKKLERLFIESGEE